jgi:hypothetical protein
LSQNIIQSLTLKCFSACRPDPLSPARRHKLIVFGIKFFSVNLSVSGVLAQRYVEAVGSRCGYRMCMGILVMCVILMVVIRLPYVLAVIHLNEVTLREVIVLMVIIIVLLILLLI